MSKPSLARGTRDFGPEVMGKRTFILDTIKQVFKKYGYLPLETPSIENLSVLMGKYGAEGDQLLFKILNSGDFLKNVDAHHYPLDPKEVLPKISEKGLRYDLTVPFARFVAMNRHEIAMPFKRFQIQPVWRADRPQKGRYREFYQCDADVVGTHSLLCEAEILLMLKEIFSGLGISGIDIKMNNRKVLAGIAEIIGEPEKLNELCVAIDKLDKIGKEKVEEELIERGFNNDSIDSLQPLFTLSQEPRTALKELKKWLQTSQVGVLGINEMEETLDLVEAFGADLSQVSLDATLARGLSYYTGAIFEVKSTDVQIGSISGGGRYDNLTGTFGLPDVSGVGISLGVDRIFDVMEELQLFPNEIVRTTKVLLVCLDQESFIASLPLLKQLRNANIPAEVYPDMAKLKKQFDYANKKDIPFVITIGSNELKENLYPLKDMQSGHQEKLNIASLINKLHV